MFFAYNVLPIICKNMRLPCYEPSQTSYCQLTLPYIQLLYAQFIPLFSMQFKYCSFLSSMHLFNPFHFQLTTTVIACMGARGTPWLLLLLLYTIYVNQSFNQWFALLWFCCSACPEAIKSFPVLSRRAAPSDCPLCMHWLCYVHPLGLRALDSLRWRPRFTDGIRW